MAPVHEPPTAAVPACLPAMHEREGWQRSSATQQQIHPTDTLEPVEGSTHLVLLVLIDGIALLRLRGVLIVGEVLQVRQEALRQGGGHGSLSANPWDAVKVRQAVL